MKKRRPDEFGFWASLPLPDADGSLEELTYALDVLKADGVAVLTNAHGVCLGDPEVVPVFAELNKMKTTVIVHPTSPCVIDGKTIRSAAPLSCLGFPNPMFEFFFDTARAVANLLLKGSIDKILRVTFIIP